MRGQMSSKAGIQILEMDIISKALLFGSEYGEMNIVEVSGQTFSKAVRVETKKKPAKVSDIELRISMDRGFEPGDAVLATFYIRAIKSSDETGAAQTQFVFVKTDNMSVASCVYPADALIAGSVEEEPIWQKYQVPFNINMNQIDKQATIMFTLGYNPQTLEIGGLELTNYGDRAKVSDLPYTKLTYSGRETGARWRDEAYNRIEKIRKGKMTISIIDEEGKPIEGAEVKCKMVRHAFKFGTAVNGARLLDQNNEDSIKYREAIQKLFNIAVLGNEMKWPNWEGKDRDIGIQCTQWFLDHGIAVRGHNLVWGSWRYLPPDLKNLKDDPSALKRRIHEHILEEAGVYKGQLIDWDVINEPIPECDLWNAIGESEIIDCFKWARQADPDAKLYLNEYHIEGGNAVKIDTFSKLLKYMTEGGAPVDGVGIQAHFGMKPPGPEIFLKNLEHFSTLVESLAITEYDINTPDEELQSDFMRDLLIACFSHPTVKSFVMWGFWDGQHWKNNAPIYRRDWSLKPSGEAFMKLVFKDWWTNTKGSTDSNGKFTMNGFFGEYDISVKYKDCENNLRITFSTDGTQQKIYV